jgi:polar amino acid transport system permease protein
MPRYTWEFSFVWEYRVVFLRGLLYTLEISFLSMALAIPLGLILSLGRRSEKRTLRYLSTIIVEFIRDTPLLVHLLWIFYCIPALTNISINAPLAAIAGLSVYTSVYLAEIFRAGIEAIEKEQIEGARVLGMSHRQTIRRIVLPQAVRRMIPPMMNQFSALIKYSSFASYLSIYELFKEIMNLSLMVFRPLEIYTTAAFVYFVPIFLCSMVSRKLEFILRKGR